MTIETSVSVGFSDGNDTTTTDPFANVSGSLSLKQVAYPVGVGSIAAKLTDTVSAGTLRLYSTEGTVSIYKSVADRIPASIQAASGVLEIDTEGRGFSWILSLDQNGDDFIPETQTVGNKLRFSQKVWGLYKLDALETYAYILKYTPDTQPGAGHSALIRYGMIAAYKAGRFASLEMEPIGGGDSADREVYRVTSQLLVNGDGQWEYPNGWPDNPTYPGGAEPVPDANTGVVTRRVHEICTINQSSISSVRTYPISVAQPYEGDSEYKPKLSFETTTEGMTAEQKARAQEICRDRLRQPFPYGELEQ